MSRSAADLLKLLVDNGFRFFGTADLMTLTEMSPFAAAQALRRLAARGTVYDASRTFQHPSSAGTLDLGF